MNSYHTNGAFLEPVHFYLYDGILCWSTEKERIDKFCLRTCQNERTEAVYIIVPISICDTS